MRLRLRSELSKCVLILLPLIVIWIIELAWTPFPIPLYCWLSPFRQLLAEKNRKVQRNMNLASKERWAF